MPAGQTAHGVRFPPLRGSRVRFALTTAMSAVLCLLMAVPASAGVDIPESGRLVYTTLHTQKNSGGGGDAWPDGVATMAMDASDRQVLLRSDSEFQFYSPSWSPDGEWILYQRNTWPDGPYQAAVMRRDGSSQQILGDHAITPTWSPDGTAIAWTRLRHDGVEGSALTIVPVLDTTLRVVLGEPIVVDLPRHALSPRFSPDGQSIAFTMDIPGMLDNPQRRLWRVDRDGSNLRRLDSQVDVMTSQFQWAPDGTRIAYMGEPNWEPWVDNGAWEPHLFIADPDGSNRRLVARPEGICWLESFAWAPSGEYLAVGGANGCFKAISPDGSAHHQLEGSDFSTMDGLSFSPDGTVIYGVARTRQQMFPDLYAFAADGSGQRRLTFDQTVAWSGVQAIDPGRVIRGFGTTSVATAASVSRRFHRRADEVVIAPNDDPGQAVAVAPLAADRGAPVLLTNDMLAAPLRLEVKRLRATKALLAGPVTDDVATRLEGLGLTVERVGGRQPAETAAAVANDLGRRRAFLVPKNERRWAHATLGSSAAALEGVAALTSARDELPAATRRAINRGGIDRITIVGDEKVIDASVARRLDRMGVTVRRIGVNNRYRLAARLATRAESRGTSVRRPVVTSGESWKHSVTTGASAARLGRVTLLAPSRRLGDAPQTQRWISKRRTAVRKLDLVGAASVVRARVETQLERQIRR